MEVRVLKPFTIGPRLFEPGYELDTSNPAYIDLDPNRLLHEGIVERLNKAELKKALLSKKEQPESKGDESGE